MKDAIESTSKRPLVLITGANRGIGHGIAKNLAAKGYSILMACRDRQRSLPALEEIKAIGGNDAVELLELDLASLESIRAFAKQIGERGYAIDALVNNAGVLSRDPRKTTEGFELTIGVNYLGPYLLTRLLLPCIRDKGGKIVNTLSVMHKFGRVDEKLFEYGESDYNGFRAYGNSKLALMLFSLELSKRLETRGISVNSVDPGIVDTNMLTMNKWFDPITDIIFRPFVKPEARGAETASWLVLNHRVDSPATGAFFVNKRERKIPKWILDHPRGKWLWDETEGLVGLRDASPGERL